MDLVNYVLADFGKTLADVTWTDNGDCIITNNSQSQIISVIAALAVVQLHPWCQVLLSHMLLINDFVSLFAEIRYDTSSSRAHHRETCVRDS